MNSTKSGVLGIFGLILGIFILFSFLNYFNILSLSALFPKYFGSLPHMAITPPARQSSTSPSPLPITLYCPAPIRPCNFKYMYRDNHYAGMGFKVRDGDPVFSIFSGQIIFTNKNASNSSIRAIVIGNEKNKSYNVNYDFIGGAIGKEVTRGITYGEPIGTASAGSLIDYKDSKGINLILQLIDPKGYTIIPSPGNFQ